MSFLPLLSMLMPTHSNANSVKLGHFFSLKTTCVHQNACEFQHTLKRQRARLRPGNFLDPFLTSDWPMTQAFHKLRERKHHHSGFKNHHSLELARGSKWWKSRPDFPQVVLWPPHMFCCTQMHSSSHPFKRAHTLKYKSVVKQKSLLSKYQILLCPLFPPPLCTSHSFCHSLGFM